MSNSASLGNLANQLVFEDANSYTFDGSDGSYQDVGHHAPLDLPNGTIALSFTMDRLYGNMALISKDNSGNGDGEFTVWVKDGKLVVVMEDGSEYESLTVPNLILDDNQTYALAVSFGEDGLMIWLDGVLVAAEAEFTSGIDNNDAALVIGGTRAWADPDDDAHSEMYGTVSDVMVFGSQLDESDIVRISDITDPAIGDAARMESWMSDLAPVFEQLHGASDTLLDILADYGVNHHGHFMGDLNIRVRNGGNHNMEGTDEADGFNGGAGNDVVRGRGGDDVLQGFYGNDRVLGGRGNDILDGGHGEDTLSGGNGNDLLISRADAREPLVGQPTGPGEGQIYPGQPIPGDDVLIGGSGADIFYFQTLINAREEFLREHTRSDGTINWHGVAGENNNVHDHWVDSIGNDVIMDYSRAEGDRIVIEGHTTEIYSITYGDANGDGVMDHSIITLYSDQGNGGGAHDDDMLGTITVYGDLITLADLEHTAGPAYGIVATIEDMEEAITPSYESIDTGPIAPPTNLPDMTLPNGLTAAFGIAGSTTFDGSDGSYQDVGHHGSLDLPNGTIALSFTMDRLFGNMALISKDNSGNGDGEFTVWVKDGKLVVVMEDGSEYESLTVPNLILDDNQTYALAVSFGEDGLMIWLDGVLVAAEAEFTSGIDNNDAALVIGGTRAWADPDDEAHSELYGTVSDVMIFGSQLDESDIIRLSDITDPAIGDAARMESWMSDLAPVFEQLHGASDTLLDILADYGVNHHGHFMGDLNVRVRNGGNHNMNGTEEADGFNGGAGNDVVRGRGGDDVLQGFYGNDRVLGGSGNDILDGGHGEDTLSGGNGNDLLISRADAREPLVGQPTGPGEGQIYPGQPIPGDDVLIGGSGADIFYFQTLINTREEFLREHTRSDGTINWHGVAGENNNVHDHWVDSIGNDVIMDYSRAEGDRIVIEGHTTEIYSITYGDANGDGVMDHSIITLYSDQGNGGGAHDDDMLGTITVYGDLITLADLEHTAGPAYGIVATIEDMEEAITPSYESIDTGPIAPPTNLPDMQDLAADNGTIPVLALAGDFVFDAQERAPLVFANSSQMSLQSGTIALSFTADMLGSTQVLVSMDATGYGNGGHFTTYINSEGDLVVRIQDDEHSYYLEVDEAVTAGRRYDLALGFGAAGLQIYINGALVAYDSEITIGLNNNSEALIIGAGGWSNSPGETNNINSHFDGTIGGFAVFDEQLTGTDIFGDAPRGDFEYFTQKSDAFLFTQDIDGNLVVTLDGVSTTIADTTEFIEFGDATFRVDDFVFGTAGADSVYGDDTNDVLIGGAGNDTLRGYGSDDLMLGGDGEDYLSGHDGADTLRGDAGNDTLYGGDGRDTLYGGDGHDKMYGGMGSDRFYGGLGDDTIYGDSWSDVQTAGSDRAYYDGNYADFSFETVSWYNSARGEYVDVLVVTDAASGGADGFYEGRDHLVDVDMIVFGDMTVAVADLL